eukprot:scaffold71328_cov20-Prasinocladus_malaysianus.AAC.2
MAIAVRSWYSLEKDYIRVTNCIISASLFQLATHIACSMHQQLNETMLHSMGRFALGGND